MGGLRLIAQPLVVAFPVRFWILNDRQSILDADGIAQPPDGLCAAPKVAELAVALQRGGVPYNMVE